FSRCAGFITGFTSFSSSRRRQPRLNTGHGGTETRRTFNWLSPCLGASVACYRRRAVCTIHGTRMAKAAVEAIRNAALWFEPGIEGLQPLVDAIGDAHVVLVGEASHGTHEVYRIRADLTSALIQQKQFNLIAVEADWPDAYRANRWARLVSLDADAVGALGDFTRFPRWMWRNEVVVDFLGWLRSHNAGRNADQRVGFYGLDLYSLHTSIEAVLGYLAKVDPDAGRRARDRYACFEHFGRDAQGYGYAATLGLSRSCEDEVVAQLVDLRKQALAYMSRDGHVAAEDYFFAAENARVG